jgi:hypothetical protein
LVEATEVFIPIHNSEILLTAVYKSPDHARIDLEIIELLSFRYGVVQFQTFQVRTFFYLFDVIEFKISAHSSYVENCDVHDIVVHQNVRLSGATVPDMLNLDHVQIKVLDHVEAKLS